MSDSLLDIVDLHYAYSDGVEALRGLTLQLASGCKMGLIGPNGSGKSTLFMCAGGLFFGEGSIRVQGEAITRSNANTFRDRVGLVFQNPDDQLFMPTLTDDLAFGPVNLGLDAHDVEHRVQQTAEELALTHLLDRAPHHLSMGQKRMAAIATVLTMRPSLLLMDEPSSNLDPRSRLRLIEMLKQLEASILIASHDLALIGQLCEQVALIDEGRIVTVGKAASVLADRDLMHAHGLDVWQNDV